MLPLHWMLLSASALVLSGCATLPSSGPTARQVVKRANDSQAEFQFEIVNLDKQAVDGLNGEQKKRLAEMTTLGSLAETPRPIVLGAGDILNISIYEVGVTLFAPTNGQASGTFDPSAHGEKFPNIVVDESGNIRLPFAGTIKVAGLTPAEAETLIDGRLRGKSQSPQTLLTVDTNISNSVFVSGDVNKPGRFPITYTRDRLLDAIASSGGSAATAEDTLIRFERNHHIVEQRLASILAGSSDDLELAPGDRIELIKRPRSFTVFGATGKVSQVSFETGEVSLAEALARVQGPSDATADPKAIFIFRYDDAIDHPRGSKPIIYRANMLDPASYFLAQRVMMQDKDVIYIANAAANQPSKFVAILNQLFSPFVTARALAN